MHLIKKVFKAETSDHLFTINENEMDNYWN